MALSCLLDVSYAKFCFKIGQFELLNIVMKDLLFAAWKNSLQHKNRSV
jgi:hypothetical protein